MKKSYAKKALLTSVLSVFLCVVMLAGTTFAWFTDIVTSDVTTIVAGVLDIEMEHMNTSTGGSYVDADGKKLFEDVSKWEPGVVTVENLKITNIGNLALEYRLSATFKNANTVIGADGNDTGKTLADALKIAFIEDETISLPTNDKAAREAALALARSANPTPLKETVYDSFMDGWADTTAAAPHKDVAVIIFWDPTANDNDFNLQNGKKASAGDELKIDLGIKLVATQKDKEKDSFDELYDEDAEYPVKTITAATESDFMAAISNVTENTVIDGNGVTMGVADQFFNIPGGVTVKNTNITTSSRGGSYIVANKGVNETLTFEDCTFKRAETGANIIAVDKDGASIVFENCVFEGPVMPNSVDNANGYTKFINCTFKITNDAFIKSGYVNCMGGKHTFIGCTFDFTGGSTMGSNQVVRWNAVNSYSESGYSTEVILDGCTFINCGTQRYGSNSTLTIK